MEGFKDLVVQIVDAVMDEPSSKSRGVSGVNLLNFSADSEQVLCGNRQSLSSVMFIKLIYGRVRSQRFR